MVPGMTKFVRPLKKYTIFKKYLFVTKLCISLFPPIVRTALFHTPNTTIINKFNTGLRRCIRVYILIINVLKCNKMTNLKPFKGKVLYNTGGKDGEYATWGLNIYLGCSNRCSYCYLGKGVLAPTLGGSEPKLKKGFATITDAINQFKIELAKNIDSCREHGVFMSFSTDPCLQETITATRDVLIHCQHERVPVTILTKRADFVDELSEFFWLNEFDSDLVVLGWTLTGHDDLEPNASPNASRIIAMQRAHEFGFRTMASIEPIIDFKASMAMIEDTLRICDMYKIGPLSGAKYNVDDARHFMMRADIFASCNHSKIYFKDGMLKIAGLTREESLKTLRSSVDSDFSQFSMRKF